jgi:hypothetical protein
MYVKQRTSVGSPTSRNAGWFCRPRQIPEGGFMSTETTVTMQDLELESAELLPSRETPYCFNRCGCGPRLELAVVVKCCL